MNQQHMHGAHEGCVPFPDPRLPYDERRVQLNAWARAQMAIAAEAFGGTGWPAQRQWFAWTLIRSAQARMAAQGAGLAGWPCTLDLRELGMPTRDPATLPIQGRRPRRVWREQS